MRLPGSADNVIGLPFTNIMRSVSTDAYADAFT
jgi:hypothetical protein